jgi:hypothetical protein
MALIIQATSRTAIERVWLVIGWRVCVLALIANLLNLPGSSNQGLPPGSDELHYTV